MGYQVKLNGYVVIGFYSMAHIFDLIMLIYSNLLDLLYITLQFESNLVHVHVSSHCQHAACPSLANHNLCRNGHTQTNACPIPI